MKFWKKGKKKKALLKDGESGRFEVKDSWECKMQAAHTSHQVDTYMHMDLIEGRKKNLMIVE